MTTPPPLTRVLETVLYARDLEAAERFYGGILGLSVHARRPGQFVFFRLPDMMLLLFHPDVSRRGRGLPPHGSEGPGHVCFAVAEGDLERWQAHLQAHGVAVEHRQRWPSGHWSLYVRDPAGNSVEFAPPAIWGLPPLPSSPTYPQDDMPP